MEHVAIREVDPIQQKEQAQESQSELSITQPVFQLFADDTPTPPDEGRGESALTNGFAASVSSFSSGNPIQRLIDEQTEDSVREEYGVPNRGWNDLRPRDAGHRRMDLATSSLNGRLEQLQDPEVLQHLRDTIDMFIDDQDEHSHLDRDQIDIALVIAIANRESGQFNFLSTNDNMVVTGGRSDTHTQGVGGMDNAGNRIDRFPSAIRDQVQEVQNNRAVPGRLRNSSRNPAYLPEHAMLAGYISEIRQYERVILRRMKMTDKGLGRFLNHDQVQALIAGMSRESRRAWIQSAFGSHSWTQIRIQRRLIQVAMRRSDAEDPFQEVLANDQVNLNAILHNDRMMHTNARVNRIVRDDAEHSHQEPTGQRSDLSGHRTRITAAEAAMVEQVLPPEILNYRRGETEARTPEPEPDTESPDSSAQPGQLMQRKTGNANPFQPSNSSNTLPESVQSKMEGSMGADFSSVNIHTNSSQASQANALAFTQGNDVHFAPGQFNPESQSGQELIGHELAHVVQQRNGNIQATTQTNGFAVNDDPGLESEADKMGAKAARFSPTNEASIQNKSQNGNFSTPFQLKADTIQRFQDNSEVVILEVLQLQDLMELFVNQQNEITLHVNGEDATFTSDWLISNSTTAMLRGEIRYRIAMEVEAGNEQTVSEMIGSMAGEPGRMSELQETLRRAIARHADEDIDATSAGSSLIENGRQGRTMAPRGPARRLEDETDEEYVVRNARIEGRPHAATDVPAETGTAVYAPIGGRVVFASRGDRRGGRRRAWGAGYGIIVRIYHPHPPETEIAGSRPLYTNYAHLSQALVREGATVHPGQAIGLVGNETQNGDGSSGQVNPHMGAHLHMSVQIATDRRGDEGARDTFGSRREERSGIDPGRWMAELGTRVSESGQQDFRHGSMPGRMAQRKQASANQSASTIQRFVNPDAQSQRDPAARRGGTLPYREATELGDCNRILGEGSEEMCREEVLGPEASPESLPSSALDLDSGNLVNTGSGSFYRFGPAATHTNYANRPQFETSPSIIVPYTGAGSGAGQSIHPVIQSPLNNLMGEMRREGARINDESLKQVVVGSSWRGPTQAEGNNYLSSLRKTIRENPAIFGTLTFPTSLIGHATSHLGFSGSSAHRAFQAEVAAAPGWNADLARQLIRITARYKSPRGGSTHHSGLVVDINFPYVKANGNVQSHNMSRSRNADALRSAAGHWLSQYSMDYDFDSYNTRNEIWHHEWRSWRGTEADPAS